jgi:nucleotide-binding universal stress UspA family protein
MNSVAVWRRFDPSRWHEHPAAIAKEIKATDLVNTRHLTADTAPSPPKMVLRLRKILVPIDFSRQSRKALRYACPFASKFGASITLLYYLVPGHDLDGSDAQVILQKVAQEEAIDPGVVQETVVSTGIAASHEIIRAARDLDADLIIMSTHLYAGVMHALFGRTTTTTDLVALDPPCPVLIIHDGGRDFVSG